MAKPGPAAGFDTIRHPQKRAVLLAYSRTMQLGAACDRAKMHRTSHYHWLKTDPAYAAAFADATMMAADTLEEEAVRRALGTEEPVYQDGAQVGTTSKHSDTLLIFLLKGGKPEKYRERASIEHTGAGGGPIQVAQLAPDARAARLAALLAKRNGTHGLTPPESPLSVVPGPLQGTTDE